MKFRILPSTRTSTRHFESTSEAYMREMTAREERREREREYACLFSKRERPGVTEAATQYHSAMQQEPKPTDTRTDLNTHIPLSLLPCTCSSCPSLPQLRFLKNVTSIKRSWCTGKPSTFSGVCRSSVCLFEEREGFRRTRVTAGECNPNFRRHSANSIST